MSAFYNVDQPPFNMGSVARAIAAANNGLLFDPSDMSTMFQDALGTTPVTAVEQPVGLILDKSQGLMISQIVAPIYLAALWELNSGTYTKTTTGWSLLGFSGLDLKKTYLLTFRVKTIVSGQILYLVRRNSAGTGNEIIAQFNITEGGIYTARVSIVKDGFTPSELWLDSNTFSGSLDNISVRELYGNHATQSVTASRPTLSARRNVLLATETLATQSVTTIAAQYTLSFTGTGSVTLSGAATGTLTGTGTDNRVSLTVTPTAGTLTLTVSGSVTKAQLELGAVAGPYQRVNTATDYDTNPALFPKYLKFDGVDDYLSLPFMSLYGGGAASIVCARDEVSQSVDTYILSERSTTNANPKYFPSRQLAGGGNMDSYISDDTAAVVLDTTGSAFSGASDKVIRSVVDTGNNIKLFKNGALAANDNYARSGTLTLNNTTIGASVSTTTSNYASMKLYGLIVTKSALTDAQRIKCERFLARKAGVML